MELLANVLKGFDMAVDARMADGFMPSENIIILTADHTIRTERILSMFLENIEK